MHEFNSKLTPQPGSGVPCRVLGDMCPHGCKASRSVSVRLDERKVFARALPPTCQSRDDCTAELVTKLRIKERLRGDAN